jgi:hypothetical protein
VPEAAQDEAIPAKSIPQVREAPSKADELRGADSSIGERIEKEGTDEGGTAEAPSPRLPRVAAKFEGRGGGSAPRRARGGGLAALIDELCEPLYKN